MFANKPRTEVVIRFVMIAVMVFNAVIPTAALAAPISKPEEGQKYAANMNVSKTLPESKPIFFTPPNRSNPQQTGPEPDKPKSPIPPRDAVEFSIASDPAIVPVNGIVTFNVIIRNNSGQTLRDLTFTDQLEEGLEYSPDRSSPIIYDAEKREIGMVFPSLRTGTAVKFSYSVIVAASKRKSLNGKIWLHDADLATGDHSLQLETSVAIGEGISAADTRSEFAVLRTNGGWNDLGRIQLHMEKNNVGANALVMSSPIRLKGRGPELQFKLDVYQTSTLATDAQGRFNEQEISITRKNDSKFQYPAFLEINLDDYIDLKNIPAGQEPYVVTYDETSEVWVKIPIIEQNIENNSVVVEAAHFSTWGAGLGSSLPQNGANVLLFDQPYTSLFTGSSRYSIPIWMPAGRVGMQPNVSLSYSSGTVDGVLGDVQAPWVGMGWNMDAVEIVRKIATDANGYGYRNEFALTLNGSLYELVRDEYQQNRYYTDKAAFLYVERHGYAFDEPSTTNASGEWWEVVTTDGTRYQLGRNPDSEQMALMVGYSCTTNGSDCITPDGAYASLGYAGNATNMVPMRWRVDKVSDTHGNYIEYQYVEFPSTTALAPFDRESYLQFIKYTGFDAPGTESDLSPAYRVEFSTIPHTTFGDVSEDFNIWDNVDSKILDSIKIICTACTTNPSNAPIRTYKFGYSLAPSPNADGTLTLTSLEISGGGYTENGQAIPLTKAPTIRFSYQDKDNRASGNGDVFKYPRLVTIDNGSGGTLTFTYEHDGRGNNSWYNYRVKNVVLNGGMGVVKKQGYTYATPVYSGWGGNPSLGSLTGYTTVTESLDLLHKCAIIGT